MKLSFRDAVPLTFSIFWKLIFAPVLGWIAGFVLGFVVGFIGAMLGMDSEMIQIVSGIGGSVLGLIVYFAFLNWILRYSNGKQFGRFRLQLVRIDSSPATSAET